MELIPFWLCVGSRDGALRSSDLQSKLYPLSHLASPVFTLSLGCDRRVVWKEPKELVGPRAFPWVPTAEQEEEYP